MADKTLKQHQYHISKVILIGNIALFVLLFLLFILNGFTPEELGDVLKFLAPIKSIYLTPIIRFIIVHKKKKEKDDTEKEIELTSLYATASSLIIYSHLTLLAILPVVSAINCINFEFFRNSIAIIEFFFGGYIGLFISDLFKVEEKKQS